MKYQNIVKAKFISRPNRFIAKVVVDGIEETAHVKNTGRCRELLIPGCTVYLEDFDGRMGNRKMRYSLIAVEKVIGSEGLSEIQNESLDATQNEDFGATQNESLGVIQRENLDATQNEGSGATKNENLSTTHYKGLNTTQKHDPNANQIENQNEKQNAEEVMRKLLINMDSQAPNKVVEEGLKNGTIAFEQLGKITLVKPETTYGDSRFDFYVEGEKGRGYIEVKGCTLENQGVAGFPDAPTERGVKHINELVKARADGYFAAIVFAVQMEGMRYLTPNDVTHPAFGDALRQAVQSGVDVRAYECKVSPDTLTVDHEIPVKL